MFGLWEFASRRRAGYPGDVTYHNHELGHDLFDDDDAEDEDEGGEGDGGEQPNQPIVNLEIKPPKLAEEEAIEPVDISEVHKLGQWLALPPQLRESAPVQCSPVTPSITPTHGACC
jgi:hypothetical protein